MAYEAVTLQDFRARFPIFAQSPDDQVTAILEEASASVDNSWSEKDFKPATLYLAAHLLATDASQVGETIAVGGSASGGAGGIASESFGGMSISYATSQVVDSRAQASQWGETEYGRRFYQLLLRNKPSITVV